MRNMKVNLAFSFRFLLLLNLATLSFLFKFTVYIKCLPLTYVPLIVLYNIAKAKGIEVLE